jgi:diguanylate cyclase (GGDEF)-like protein/PAS domain S-box-containing protein
MSIAAHALAGAGIATSAAAAATLWLAARRRPARVRLAYLWFAAAAAFWCLGIITQQALGAPLSGVAVGLTFADLPPLLALPAAVAGVAALVAAGSARASDGWRTLGQRVATRPVIPRLADGYIAAAALFVVGWITLFGPKYVKSGGGPGSFAVQLIHPLAGLVAVGLLLSMVAEAGRQAVPPVAAVLLVTVSDALGVSARLNGAGPGAAQQIILIAAFCVLSLTPWLAGRQSAGGGHTANLPGAAAVASIAAALAALVGCGWALAGGHGSPALIVVASVAVLALAARVFGLVVGGKPGPRAALESAQRFHDLAELTSDVVLVCELDGVIKYASPAVAEYGYSPESLPGTRLDDSVHPEDRPGSRQAVIEALGRQSGLPGRFPCRVRSADGTWRHVEATVSPYRDPAGSDQLLVTARDVSDQVALRRQVTHLTYHDGLTGLPNRAYLEERAASALGRPAEPDQEAHRRGGQAGAIFLDLDGFTAVNDSVGHRAGDLLIAQAARRLRAAVPPHETVVRWGGDEFAVLVEEAAGAQEIVDLAERLAASVTAGPFRVAGRDISLTASVGVAFAGSDPPGFVLRNADVAMGRAKESGGGRVEVFAAQMHKDVVSRLELTSDLQRAITDGQLVVEYQPVVELATSRVSGAEALVRWWRGGAAVPPGEFLGVAEESGLIVPLGDWVLRQACAQAAKWGRTAADMSVSVNFSQRQVSAEHFPESVLAALSDAGLPPEALTLEVNERVLVEATSRVVEHLGELRRAGVRLAIDDFGTGYASLAYLRQLQVDIIKIDPSFVAGLGEDETLTLLVRTIIQLSHDLGISVVAEGIESSLQLGMLRDMGCGLGQGYLVAAPMAAAEVESLITAAATLPGGGSAPPDAEAEAVVSVSETQLHGS